MWFMNKIANPLVGLILRSPLHGLFSAALLLITYRGRKSGKEYSLPVQYAQDGSTIYIVPGSPKQKTWWRNFKGGTPVQVVLRGKRLTGNGTLLNPATDSKRIITGLGLYMQRFPDLAKYHNLRLKADGHFAEDPGRAAETTVVIQITVN